jgi:hypothetical protein
MKENKSRSFTMRNFFSVFAVAIAALLPFSPSAEADPLEESAEITVTMKNVKQHVLAVAKKYAEAISCEPGGFHVFAISPYTGGDSVYDAEYGVIWDDAGPMCDGGNGGGGSNITVVRLHVHGGPTVDSMNSFPQLDIVLASFEKVVSANENTIVIHGGVVGDTKYDSIPVTVTLKKDEGRWKVVKTEKHNIGQ